MLCVVDMDIDDILALYTMSDSMQIYLSKYLSKKVCEGL